MIKFEEAFLMKVSKLHLRINYTVTLTVYQSYRVSLLIQIESTIVGYQRESVRKEDRKRKEYRFPRRRVSLDGDPFGRAKPLCGGSVKVFSPGVGLVS